MTIPYINLLQTVWQNGKAFHKSIMGYYCAYILAQGFLSLSPYAFGRTIDLLQHFSTDKFHAILFWLILGVMLHPLFWLFHGPARVVERNVALKIQQTFMQKLYHQLTQLPLKWHQNHHSGDTIARINMTWSTRVGSRHDLLESYILFYVLFKINKKKYISYRCVLC